MEFKLLSLPFVFGFNGTGLYATALSQKVVLRDSPVKLTLDPPVANVSEVDYEALEKQLVDLLRDGGAVIL